MDVLLHALAKYPIATVSTLAFYALLIAAAVPGLRERFVPYFSHPISPQQSFLSSMDALRGFAAAYVAFAHCWHWTYPVFYKSQLTIPALAYGAKAVPMFCVLSGFLIYRSVRNIQSREDSRYYIARRIFRIYPLYLLSVALCLILGQVTSDHKEIGTLAYLVSEIFMLRSLGFPLFANPVTWSLYIEVIFYVFLPIYVMFVGRARILPASIIMLVVLIIADQVPGREFQLWKYFFFGIVASELSLRYENELRTWIGTALLTAGTVLLILDLGGPRFDWVAHAGFVKRNLSEYTIGLGLSFAMIAATISHVASVGRVLNLFPLRFIGVVSYSVFIVHPFYLMVNFPDLVLRKVGTQTELWKTHEAMPDWYLLFLFAPGIFAWAAITFVLIERPALIAGSRAIKLYRTSGQPSDASDARVRGEIRQTIKTCFGAAAAVLFAVYFLAWTQSPPGQSPGASAQAPRCQIEIGPERCPGMPTFEPAKTQLVFDDDWQGSGSNLELCLRRAVQFHAACKSTSPVTARYFLGSKMIRSETKR